MNILDIKNIKKLVIALIVIFGIIFIIIGERPRHKADIKNPITEPASGKVTEQPAVNNVTQTEITAAPSADIQEEKADKVSNKPVEDTSDHDQLISSLNGKEIIASKYSDADNTLMEQAIKDHQSTTAEQPESISTKDNTDTELSEAGLAKTADKLSITRKDTQNIQKAEDKDSQSLNSLLDISEPEIAETSAVNPAITKEEELQDKYPQRYSTSTVIGTEIVYAIDTTTAEVSVLLEGNTYWINLGKPDGAQKNKLQTYILEGATKDSAIVLDTLSAQAWRVKFSNDNIEWSVIKPFPSDK